MAPTILISRSGDAHDLRRALEDSLADMAGDCGARVLLCPDLYHLQEDSPLWLELAGLSEPIVAYLWLRPRAGEWLLRKHGVGQAGLAVHDLAAFTDAASAWAAAGLEDSADGSVRELTGPTSERWYPLMDRDRCIQCRHCLQFCLFGVYGEPGGEVQVVEPDACKDGCPACARVCPRGAIIFPLYDEDDAISGATDRYPEPDAAARHMYYERTGATCPACAARSEAGDPDGGPAECPECGKRLTPAHMDSSLAREVDALLDDLDARLRRS